MRYAGGKHSLAKKIVSILERERNTNMTWIEPFVGSGKVIAEAKGKRVGSDVDQDVIDLLKALQNGYEPPNQIDEIQYKTMKKNPNDYPSHLIGFVKHACSFGGLRWGSFARAKGVNFAEQGRKSCLKLAPKIKDVEFKCLSYNKLVIPDNSIIYCDPPYEPIGKRDRNKEVYGLKFNYELFYDWCREQAKLGHLVFVSSYKAPNDFTVIYEQGAYSKLNPINKVSRTEKLFRVHKKQGFKLITY